MKQFVLIYRDPNNKKNMEKAHQMPKEMRDKIMGKWEAWGAKVGARMVNFGAPFGESHTVNSEGVTEGPTNTGGYTVIKASSTDEVLKLIEGHPHLEDKNCSIDIFEAMNMGG